MVLVVARFTVIDTRGGVVWCPTHCGFRWSASFVVGKHSIILYSKRGYPVADK